MVEKQLRAMGLSIKAPPKPTLDDDVRCPRGRPPKPRAGWEQYLVAVKRACDPGWPASAAGQITAARRLHDNGTHLMTQTTSKEGWIHLYCVPRKRPAPPTDYFASLEARA